MKLAFFVMGFGCAAATAALRPHAQTKPAMTGLLCLALTVVGLMMAGLFDQDPITSTVVTREGTFHAVATMIGIPGFTLASLLLGLSLARRWPSHRTPLLVLSDLPWIAFASMIIYIAVAMRAGGGFGPTVLVGLINRLYLGAMCAWLLFVAWHADRQHATRFRQQLTGRTGMCGDVLHWKSRAECVNRATCGISPARR